MSESGQEQKVKDALRRYLDEYLTDGLSIVPDSHCTSAMLEKYEVITHGKPSVKQPIKDKYGKLYLITVCFDEHEDKEVFWVIGAEGLSAKFEV